MRWVDRGPEPDGVAGYRLQFTQGWVDYFENRIGGRPNDSYWRQFRGELSRRFSDNCGYCERKCDENADDAGRSPTVDHFRPLNRYPRLSYEWSNWIFCCRRCNEDYKRGNWPSFGYIDPCAVAAAERPERYFDYSHSTGEIIPKPRLTQADTDRARRTITDLGLNALDMRINRRRWIDRLISSLRELAPSEWPAIVDGYTAPSAEYGGIAAMFLARYQQPGR